MRTIEVKLYQFDELPTDKAKERARDWFRECEAQDFGAHGELWERAETAAKLLGITFDTEQVPLMSGKTRCEPHIMYSGFSSQGDGASFTGDYEYRKGASKAVRKEFGEDADLYRIADALTVLQAANGYRLHARIKQGEYSGHYVHSHTMSADVVKRNPRNGDEDEASDETAEALLDLMRNFADWIYDGIKKEYYYRMEDENVDESIRANEYEFTVDGKRA